MFISLILRPFNRQNIDNAEMHAPVTYETAAMKWLLNYIFIAGYEH